MATYVAYTAADLRTYLGFWDTSEEEKVAGSAVARDRVVIGTSGTIDMGAADNILMPPAGVWIDGPGRDVCTVQGRLAIQGSGGQSTVTRLSGWKLDVNGLGTLSASGLATFGAYGASNIEDTSLFAENWAAINGSVGTDGNTLTLVSRAAAPAIYCVLHDCYFTGATNDCFATKGISGAANTGSECLLFACSGKTPGGGASDQVFSPHDGFAMHLYECFAEGGTAAYAVASDAATTPMDVINCHLRGGVVNVRKLAGCLVDRFERNESVIVPTPNGLVEHCLLTGTAYDSQTQGGLRLAAAAGTTTIRYCEIIGNNTGRVTCVRDAGATTATAALDHVLMRTAYRGPDLRNGTGHKIENCLIDAANYSFLYTDTANLVSVTGTKVTTNEFPDEGIITPAAIDAGEITALSASVQLFQQTMPYMERARNRVLINGGWARPKMQPGLLLPI